MAESKVEVIQSMLGMEPMADHIGKRWHELKTARSEWEKGKLELRNYVFATDTRTTTNKKADWRNTTTVPKLCQIRDSLQINYLAALFPRSEWLTWMPGTADAADKEVASLIKAYMRTKLEDSGFEGTVGQLILDYIDYGNAIADVEYVHETYMDEEGVEQVKYSGPRLVRINPLDCVFDITAASFDRTPKITRSIMSLGDLVRYAQDHPEKTQYAEAVEKAQYARQYCSGMSSDDVDKAIGWKADGFGSASQYFNSGLVEILEFEGDYYDANTGTLHTNRRITVVDRSYVLRDEPIDNWTGGSYKTHVGWRIRQDNLIAMGPLDNIVGMQYRIDHLQNVKSDMHDLTAFPPLALKGAVPDFEWRPFEKIRLEDDAEIKLLSIPVDALRTTIEIDWLEMKMEQLAGSPREALGIRSPGEKTMYEVQSLENAASRTFQHKIKHFERNFLEPLINKMLACARANLLTADVARLVDDTYGFKKFMSITPDIIKTKGRIRPVGALSFSDRANMVQNLTQLTQSGMFNDQGVRVHWSGLELSKMMSTAMGFDEFKLVSENIQLAESQRTQQVQTQMQEGMIQEQGQLSLEEEEQLAREEQLQQPPVSE